MNRKQLFMNPAETNAHGSIRTAKWAKGAVAVVALSGAFGVASMNTTTASADEIQAEVVAPTLTEEVAATTEVVVTEQPTAEVTPVVEASTPVEEVTSVETPVVEAVAAVEEVVPAVESAVAVTENVAEVPAETVVAEQPAVEATTADVDVTAAEAVTNAGKEVASSDYTATGSIISTTGRNWSTTPIEFDNVQTSIDVSVPDASKISVGDTITFVTKNNVELYTGKIVDAATGKHIANVASVSGGVNLWEFKSDPNSSVYNPEFETLSSEKVAVDRTYLLTFVDGIADLDSTNFSMKKKYVHRTAILTEDYKGTTMPLTVNVGGNNIISSSALNSTSPLLPKGTYRPDVYTSNYYVTDNGAIFAASIGGENYKAGDVLTWELSDPDYNFSLIGLQQPDGTYAKVSVGTVIDLPKGSIIGTNGSNLQLEGAAYTNANGVYGHYGWGIKYEVLEATDNKVSIKILEDTPFAGNIWVARFDTTLTDATNVGADGKLLTDAPTVHTTNTRADGSTIIDKDVTGKVLYQLANSKANTVLTQRYPSTLNAVHEDGTVIKKNMDATGLLKVGERFTLNADKKITYNGIVYIPADDETTVSGTTIDRAQVLTKVYIYSPQDNHAFVDLTVNHIDKETGAVMKTTTTGNHEETTTYTTNAETFPEYNLVATPDNATGTFGKDAVVVNYYYIHKKGNVVAKFVREDGTEIAPVVNVVTNVNTGTDYTATHPAEIAFDRTVYRYTGTDGSETGKVTEGTTTITNRYVLVKGTLIEKYVDVNGAEIKAQNTVLDDAPVKTAYSLEHPNEIQANGTTYRYVRTDGAETGQLVEGTTVVTYIYDTVKGDVVVKVVDAKTGNDIFPAETVVDDKPITKATYDVTSYNKARITGKDGKTWDLVSVDGNQTGKVVEGVTTITFKYNEVKTSVTTKLVSTDGKELRSPSTDADLSTGVTYNTISKAPEVIYATDNNVYKRTAIPSNSQGITTVDPITVTYIYELQTAEPTKTIASTDGRDLTGKVLLAGDKVVYKFSTDLAKFKGIDGLSTEDKQHALIIVEDIADEFLTPNMSQASVSSGKAFLNYYASIEEAPESIKSVLSAKEVSTTGGFAVLTSFNPLATAEEVKAQNLAFFNEFTNKGLNVSVVLPTTVNATVDNAKIENKVIQIDFDGVTESPVVVNETPDINPTKDIVLNAGDEESLQGKQITVGTVFNYELSGTVYPANRGNKLTSYQQVDKHSDKVLPTGVYLTKATAEIQFEDGYKLGDEIIIPAGTVVKGSWITPVDIVSDKDGSVIKAGSTVVKDGSPQVEYTIEKDIVVAAGTNVTGIVFPIGSDFSAIFRQFIDAENNTVTYSMRQDAFEKISADSAFGFTTYMQVEQIAAGTTENTYTEIVNGVETKSNTVTHEGVEPEVPGDDTPVSAAGVATLPNTGEENSSAAALAGAAMLVATLGLAGRRRKEEK